MCENDGECPGAQVCYTNLTWTDAPLCDCSHYYGGQGPDCSELSAQSYINAALVGSGVAAIVILLIGTLLTDVRVSMLRYKVFAWDNTTLTWAYAVTGMLCLLVWGSFVLVSALEPSKNDVILEGQAVQQKIAQFGLEERIFVSLAIFFAMTAALNISLSWVDVANQTRRFNQSRKGFATYKRIIRLVQAVWLLVLLIQLFLGLTIAVVATGVVVALGCLVTYIIGRVRFVRVLEESLSRSGSRKGGMRTEEDKRITRVLNLIRTTSTGVIIAIGMIFVIAGAMVPISLNWQEYGRPGGVSAYATLLHSLTVAFLIALATMLNYCHRMFNNAVNNKREREKRRIESSAPSYMMSNLTNTNAAKATNSVEESI